MMLVQLLVHCWQHVEQRTGSHAYASRCLGHGTDGVWLQAVCVLAGCDFLGSVKGVGPVKAHSFVKRWGPCFTHTVAHLAGIAWGYAVLHRLGCMKDPGLQERVP